MLQLRLVGIHDGGDRLLLSGPDGEQFTLPVDEALRSAVHRAGRQAPSSEKKSAGITPRDIQSRIRAGATADEVAEEFGLELKHVQRYEGPVIAEREHIVRLAQAVEVGTAAPAGDAFRGGLDEEPVTLVEIVEQRLKSLGVDSSTLRWDSKKTGSQVWEVSADFVVPDPEHLGEQPPARWSYNTSIRTLQNGNRWAQHLSEPEATVFSGDSPLGTRHLTSVSDRPFNVETDNPITGPLPVSEAESLIDLLNARRGQRLGVDEESDDALATLLSHGVPAAHPRHEEDALAEFLAEAEAEAQNSTAAPGLHIAPPVEEEIKGLTLHDGVSTETREIRIVPPQPSERAARLSLADEIFARSRHEALGEEGIEVFDPDELDDAPDRSFFGRLREAPSAPGAHARDGENPMAATPAPPAAHPRQPEVTARPSEEPEPSPEEPGRQPESRATEKKRRSVPSWDEIMFGTKND